MPDFEHSSVIDVRANQLKYDSQQSLARPQSFVAASLLPRPSSDLNGPDHAPIAGDIFAADASVQRAFKTLFQNSDRPTEEHSLMSVELNAGRGKVRPVVCLTNKPQVFQNTFCMFATFNSASIDELPPLYRLFIMPISPNCQTRENRVRTCPTWNHDSGWVVAIQVSFEREEIRGRWTRRKRRYENKETQYSLAASSVVDVVRYSREQLGLWRFEVSKEDKAKYREGFKVSSPTRLRYLMLICFQSWKTNYPGEDYENYSDFSSISSNWTATSNGSGNRANAVSVNLDTT